MSEMRDAVINCLIAGLACLFCIWLLRPLAIRVGFVDRPDERKTHLNNIPLIGGIAIFFGFCFALLNLRFSLLPFRSLLAGSALIVLMGVVDDFRDLRARLKLFGQIMVALILIVWGQLNISHLGNIFFSGDINIGYWGMLFTLLVVVSNLNALNMLDGQDGLAGSIALGQAFWLMVFAYELQSMPELHLLMILIALLLVFLSFNMSFPWRSQASIFMGDSGSTFLAFVLAWMAIFISQNNIGIIKPVSVLWVMALPIFDLLNVILHRIRQKKSIFTAGRDHLHHVLHFAGMKQSLSTLLLFIISFTFGFTGYAINHYNLSEGLGFLLFVVTMVTYLFVVSLTRNPLLKSKKIVITAEIEHAQ